MNAADPPELVIEVKEAEEGGFVARAAGESIFVEAEDWDSLTAQVRDAVVCHFPEEVRPGTVWLHWGARRGPELIRLSL